MTFRVFAKGFTDAGEVRERYEFTLLCTQEHAERVARLYLTHLQSKGGMWTVKVTDMAMTAVVFTKSNYVRPMQTLMDRASTYITSPMTWTTTGTTGGMSSWDNYVRAATRPYYATY